MNEDVALIRLVDDPIVRRLWLLYNAVQNVPFDRAIELARSAEAFVTGSIHGYPFRDAQLSSELPAGPVDGTLVDANSHRSDVQQAAGKARVSLSLPGEQRDQLLARLAAGARNAELATEFGLSSKQVQGIRMGCAREVAKRRNQDSRTSRAGHDPCLTASIEDIIRFLRQQDDVVVPQQDGQFLINGRFQMSQHELVARANRMRTRQRKPQFELPGAPPARPERITSANGHPIFWDKTSPAEPS